MAKKFQSYTIETKTIHALPCYAQTLKTVLNETKKHIVKYGNTDMGLIYDHVIHKIEENRTGVLDIFGGEISIVKNALQKASKKYPDDAKISILKDRMELTRKQFTDKYGTVDFMPAD